MRLLVCLNAPKPTHISLTYMNIHAGKTIVTIRQAILSLLKKLLTTFKMAGISYRWGIPHSFISLVCKIFPTTKQVFKNIIW